MKESDDTPPTSTPDVALTPLAQARDAFIAQWGAMGTAWGINRTMARSR